MNGLRRNEFLQRLRLCGCEFTNGDALGQTIEFRVKKRDGGRADDLLEAFQGSTFSSFQQLGSSAGFRRRSEARRGQVFVVSAISSHHVDLGQVDDDEAQDAAAAGQALAGAGAHLDLLFQHGDGVGQDVGGHGHLHGLAEGFGAQLFAAVEGQQLDGSQVHLDRLGRVDGAGQAGARQHHHGAALGAACLGVDAGCLGVLVDGLALELPGLRGQRLCRLLQVARRQPRVVALQRRF